MKKRTTRWTQAKTKLFLKTLHAEQRMGTTKYYLGSISYLNFPYFSGHLTISDHPRLLTTATQRQSWVPRQLWILKAQQWIIRKWWWWWCNKIRIPYNKNCSSAHRSQTSLFLQLTVKKLKQQISAQFVDARLKSITK